MGYLRPVRFGPNPATSASACVDAFDRELDYLFATLHRLGARPREIEDLAQETFMVLHKNWTTLDTARPLRPYLFGVAFRVVSAHRRRGAREVSRPTLEAEDVAAGPERLLQGKESRALLFAALERVPLPRRAVVIMHDLDGLDVADIAEQLSISRFGTYARLRKGRKELAGAVRRLVKEGVTS
jgi:RNA polymerase sigma-70 factor (ECF subfamily)